MSTPLYFDNNDNTILQKDQYSTYQNVAYFDADNGMIIGPNDPRMSIITQVPINCFRPQPFSDFDERSLDAKWLFTPAGSGTVAMANSCAVILSGLSVNNGGELKMTNVPIYMVAGQRVYFYLSTPTNGNLDLEFGIKVDSNNLVRFKRSEDNTAQAYSSETRASGTSDSYSGVCPGDSVRRIFCIELVTNAVKFWVGTDMGELVLQATHTTCIPSGTGNVYLKFTNRYTANREVDLDFVWPIRIR